MNSFHQDLKDRWSDFSIFEQMANVGAEAGRAVSWWKRDLERSKNAYYRALELLDFTAEASLRKPHLKEVLRVREILVDYFSGDNVYKSDGESINKYFLPFNIAARKKN